MTESALLASLGVAVKAARPLGRGSGGGVKRETWASRRVRRILALGLGHVGLMLASWALLGALLGILNVFLIASGSLWRLLVDLGLDFWLICARILIYFLRFFVSSLIFFAFEAIVTTL